MLDNPTPKQLRNRIAARARRDANRARGLIGSGKKRLIDCAPRYQGGIHYRTGTEMERLTGWTYEDELALRDIDSGRFERNELIIRSSSSLLAFEQEKII